MGRSKTKELTIEEFETHFILSKIKRLEWESYNRVLLEYIYEGYETPVGMMDRLIKELEFPVKMKPQQQD